MNNLSFSQNSEPSSQPFIDSASTGWLSFNLSPLCLLDSYSGSAYRGGLQFRPLKRISIGADGGGYIESITKITSGIYNIEGYHTRIRMSYFPEKLLNYSFGIEYQFKQQLFSYLDSTATEPTFEANVSKKVYCYNIFVAYDHNFTNHLFLDVQFGVGLRYREIFNTRSDVVGSTSYAWPWDSMTNGRVTTGKNYLPNFTLAIRLGFSFFRN